MTRPWYPFYWADYSSKTFNLTQGQHGAYVLLMRHIYTTGQPIPLSEAYSLAKATLENERENVDYVLSKFFFQKEGWQHQKVNEIMDQAEEKHKKLVESGTKGAKARYSHPIATLEPGYSKSQSESHPQLDKESANDFLNFNGNFDLDLILRDDTRQKARDLSNGWDLYALISLFNEQVRSGKFKKPKYPDGAFLAWIPKFTKGNRP